MSETLRLLCPQWQGAGTSSVRQLAAEFPFEVARRGYAVGTAVLDAILPPADGLTTTAPVAMGDEGLELVDGVEAKAVVVDQLARSLQVIEEHDPERIVTLGGDCAVSVAPFSWLTRLHGDDLAVLWIDSHPDIGTPASDYPGFHAMAVAALTGHGDPDILDLLPATISADRVALVGLHEWTEDDIPNSPPGTSDRSPRTTCARRPVRCSTDWPAPAAPRWRSTSTSTRSTATRSCWAWAPSRTACAATRSAASSPMSPAQQTSSASRSRSSSPARSCACNSSCRAFPCSRGILRVGDLGSLS